VAHHVLRAVLEVLGSVLRHPGILPQVVVTHFSLSDSYGGARLTKRRHVIVNNAGLTVEQWHVKQVAAFYHVSSFVGSPSLQAGLMPDALYCACHAP
jgi:hypothetical protein